MKGSLPDMTGGAGERYSRASRAETTHFLVIVTGIVLLLQDLLAENVKSFPLLHMLIKYIDETVPLVMLTLFALTRLARGRWLRGTPVDLPLVLFLAVAVVSSILAEVPGFIVASQFLLYVKGFVVFYLLYNLPISRGIFQDYRRIFFWVGVVFFLFGIVDLFIPETLRRITGNVEYIEYRGFLPSVKSLFIHPAVFGWFMSFLALYCFALAFLNPRPLFFAAGLFFSAGCFLSMRARSIFGLMTALLLGFIFVSKRKRLALVAALVPIVAVGAVLVGPSLLALFQSRIDIYVMVEHPLEVARSALYFKGFAVARDAFPFGAGMGRYGSYLSRLYYSPVYERYGLSNVWGMSKANPVFITDTFWPMIMGESGFIGLVLYVLLLVTMIKMQIGRVKNSIDTELKAFQLGTFMIIIIGVIESIADPIFTGPPAALFIFGAVGLSAAVSRMPENEYVSYRGTLT